MRGAEATARTGASREAGGWTGSQVAPDLSMVIPTFDNLPVLQRCLESWQRHAMDAPVELIVVEDGCTDGTAEWLEGLMDGAWRGPPVRVLHAADAHELVCTNLGFAAAAAPLIATWHDDMFLRVPWLVPELIATFDAYPELGLLSLGRGLTFPAVDEPVRTWEDTVSWRRVQSTIGRGPLNWLRLQEVDAVVRPWVVRRACIDRVGSLDEAFRPTEWDEADLCYRIREAGWLVATHGYERLGAYHHRISTTYGRTPSARRKEIGFRNGRLFFERWSDRILADRGRPRRTWLRRAAPSGWLGTARGAARGVWATLSARTAVAAGVKE